MNPTHREFFLKLHALCREYSAAIGRHGAGPINIFIDTSYYTINTLEPYNSLYVTEKVERLVQPDDEEPKP
jgi:hypothetical protein